MLYLVVTEIMYFKSIYIHVCYDIVLRLESSTMPDIAGGFEMMVLMLTIIVITYFSFTQKNKSNKCESIEFNECNSFQKNIGVCSSLSIKSHTHTHTHIYIVHVTKLNPTRTVIYERKCL